MINKEHSFDLLVLCKYEVHYGHILIDSNHVTFCKKQNGGDSRKIHACQGLGEMSRWSLEHF